jgi:hypothetical protein
VARAPNVGWIIVEPSERGLQSLTLARVCRLRAPLAEPRGATREGGAPQPLGTTTPCLTAPEYERSGRAEHAEWMKRQVVILGAGFGGLELSTLLSDLWRI